METKPKESNFVSAVVYARNEEKTIGPFLDRLYNVLRDHFKKFEVICVDDNSHDSTCETIKRLGKEIKETQLTIIHMSYYQGVEAAMNAGVDLSIGDFVFEFDSCNMDFEPNLIMQVYYRSLQGYDIVSAAPEHRGQVSSHLFYSVFNKHSNTSYRLQTERFRILSRRVINRVHDINATIPYRKIAYASSGLKMDTMKYSCTENSRKNCDRSEEKLRKDMAVDTLIMYTNVAYRFSSWMSLLLSAFALLSGIYSLIVFLVSGAVEGWTTTMLFLSVVFFGVFVILTMIIKYLSIIVKLLVNRKEYNIESIEKVTA